MSRRKKSSAIISNTVTPAEQFKAELEIFRTEAQSAGNFLYGYLGVHAAAAESAKIRTALNTAPLFWNVAIGAMQLAAFIVLGRIFDMDQRTHNIGRLMRIARDNPGIFSRQALAARRPEVGNAYLQHVHVPTRADFLRLQAHVGRNRKIYRARYGDLRNKLFAHKERMDQASINSLLAQTNIRELQRITVFLLSLESALWHLFTNGHKPILRPSHFSIASMRKHLRANGRDRSSQELVVHEIERFLSHASRPDIF